MLKPGVLRHHEDPSTEPAPHSWSDIPASSFQLRVGPAYRVNGKKAPSAESLYEVFAIDAYRTAQKVPHIGRCFAGGPDPDRARLGGIYSYLIMNVMIPSYAPGMVFQTTDGEGWCIVFHLRLRTQFRDAWLSGNPPNAMKLLREFMNSPPDSALRKRCKIIARVDNLDDCPLNAATRQLFKRYNSTPFLVRTTSSFYEGPNYFEIDIDVHNFGKPARMGLHGMREALQQVVFDWSAVIEGETDEELPEQLLFCARFNKLESNAVPVLPPVPGG